MSDVFISYSRKDLHKAESLARLLKGHGFSVWIDREAIEPSQSWGGSIVHGIETCKVFCVLLSNHALQSENVAKEVALASKFNRCLLPVLVEPVLLSGEIEYHLSNVQSVPIHSTTVLLESVKSQIGVPSDVRSRSNRVRKFVRPRNIVLTGVAVAAASYFIFPKQRIILLSQNQKAVEWYQKSKRTADLAQRSWMLGNAIAEDSMFSAAYTDLATVYLQQATDNNTKLNDAKVAILRALLANPKYPTALAALTSIYMREGQLDMALQTAREYFMFRNFPNMEDVSSE